MLIFPGFLQTELYRRQSWNLHSIAGGAVASPPAGVRDLKVARLRIPKENAGI